jgi:hypothetical protein
MAETCACFKGKKQACSLQSIKREVTHWGKPVGEQSQVGLTPHLRLLWRQVRGPTTFKPISGGCESFQQSKYPKKAPYC